MKKTFLTGSTPQETYREEQAGVTTSLGTRRFSVLMWTLNRKAFFDNNLCSVAQKETG